MENEVGKIDIQRVAIADINFAPYNPREDLKPGEAEYEALRASIKQGGFVEPPVLNRFNMTLIGGHQRVRVLRDEFGATHVDCSMVTIEDEKKEKALNIALNKITGRWDRAKFKTLLLEFEAVPAMLDGAGVSPAEFDAFTSWDDAPKVEEKPEVPFTEEMNEEHNYLVLYFDNDVDWIHAQSLFPLRTVKSLDSRPGFEKQGVGRVVRGIDFIRAIQEAPHADR